MTTVTSVEGSEIVLGAGRLQGLTETSMVTLLREGEPIVHPLTGEVLGVPQEPVGTVQVMEVSDNSARGAIVKMYSEPMKGDQAEFQPMEVMRAEPTMAVREVMEEMAALRESVERVRQRDDGLRSYPDFARRALDEISAMRAYLVSLDERLIELEEQQSEDHFRMTSVLSGEYRRQDMKELTIRYSPDTQVRLRSAGTTLLIDVVADSVQWVPEMASSVSMELPQDDAAVDDEPGLLAWFNFDDDGGDDDEGEKADMMDAVDGMPEPWYKSGYHLAGGIGLVVALAIMVALVIKRRYSDVMDGLEDFDDEYEGYLEDDEDEDE